MKKYHFVFDNLKKNIKIKKILLKKYKNYPPHISNVIIVLGGDGFMLETLKKYQKYNKAFYGINRGTYGFLMNKYKNLKVHNFVNKVGFKVLEYSEEFRKKYYHDIGIKLDKSISEVDKQYINELFFGDITKHTAYIIKDGNI